jgi:ubiquinone/menaquinone biosynthesis C-methylase UbiE
MSNETWRDIWERKGQSVLQRGNLTVADLAEADGFDSATGRKTEASWLHLSWQIRRLLNVRQHDRILEVGCGAGAVLRLLAETGASLSGIDYSAPHLEIARRMLPSANFQHAAANNLPFGDATFEAVFAYGVFLYFDDLAYAEKALQEMLRVTKPGGKMLIMDIPDAAKRLQTEAARRAAGAFLHPPHLYYPKDFFRQFALSHQLPVAIFDQDVPGYANAAFRFNAVFG